MEPLEGLRAEFDRVDAALLALFVQRMRLSAQIDEVKRAQGLPVYDAAREQAVLNKMTALSPEEFSGAARRLWTLILQLSREIQESGSNRC